MGTQESLPVSLHLTAAAWDCLLGPETKARISPRSFFPKGPPPEELRTTVWDLFLGPDTFLLPPWLFSVDLLRLSICSKAHAARLSSVISAWPIFVQHTEHDEALVDNGRINPKKIDTRFSTALLRPFFILAADAWIQSQGLSWTLSFGKKCYGSTDTRDSFRSVLSAVDLSRYWKPHGDTQQLILSMGNFVTERPLPLVCQVALERIGGLWRPLACLLQSEQMLKVVLVALCLATRSSLCCVYLMWRRPWKERVYQDCDGAHVILDQDSSGVMGYEAHPRCDCLDCQSRE